MSEREFLFSLRSKTTTSTRRPRGVCLDHNIGSNLKEMDGWRHSERWQLSSSSSFYLTREWRALQSEKKRSFVPPCTAKVYFLVWCVCVMSPSCCCCGWERERVGAAGRRLGGPRRGGKNTNGGRSRVEGGFKEEVGGIYGRRPP